MFNGSIFIEGNTVLNFLMEEGICTEDAEGNLRGDLHLEILVYIQHRLNGLVYLRRIGDFRGDSLILRLL